MDIFDEVSKVAKSRAAVADDDGMNDPVNDQKNSPVDDMPDEGVEKETLPERGAMKEEIDLPEQPKDLASQYDFDEEDFAEVEPSESDAQDKKDEAEKIKPASENAGQEAEEQIARARLLGLTVTEIKEFSQMGNLGKILDALERQKGTTTQEARKPPEGNGEAAQTGASLNIDDFKIELDENYFDPELVDELNEQIKSKLGPVIKQLSDSVTTLKNQLESERRTAFEREFDGLIGALDDSYTDLLGKEPGRKLDPNSKQMQNRVKVLQTMATLGQTQAGVETPELFSQAVALVFKDQMKQIAAHEILNSLKKRQGQLMGRPENRKRTLPPREKAVQSVSAFLLKEGYNAADEAFDEEEFS